MIRRVGFIPNIVFLFGLKSLSQVLSMQLRQKVHRFDSLQLVCLYLPQLVLSDIGIGVRITLRIKSKTLSSPEIPQG